MSAGTLTLTNNSAAVTGSGTAFTTELAVGDFIVVTVGGIPYTLAIKTVNSNTSLTLVSNYTGPTQGGAAWYAVPRVAMNLVTAALVAQSAEALRGLNYDKQNWQRLFSASGNITVTLPDGSSFTGPSWNSFTAALNEKADKASLGSAAAKDAGTNSGNVMLVGAFNLGAIQADGPTLDNMDGLTPTGFTSHQNDGLTQLGLTSNTGLTSIILNRGNRPTRIHQAYSLRRTWFSYYSGIAWAYHEAYTTGNTTKSSDGTLKAASPVARIVKSREDCQREDIDSDGFSWCGGGTANEEAEGIKISRLDVGVYVLTGSAGLASEGWQLLPPMDPGGMGELGVVEAEQTEGGGLTIRLFKRKYILNEEGEIVKTKGAPIDVPANSWIDVRLDMPEDSIWKTRASEASLELTEQPEDIQP